jgi:predicted TIM-barrel fold metal-dependent hydrolase
VAATLIDWHAHHSPPELSDKVAELGGRRPVPDDLDSPDFSRRLAEMDEAGVDIQLVCQTARVDAEGWPPQQARALIQTANNALASRVAINPQRLFGVISITLRDVDGSVQELERMQAKGFRAVLMYPRCEGEIIVDRPEIEPLFAKISELDLPIFLHGGGGSRKDPSLERLEDRGAGVSSSIINEASICEWSVRGIAAGLFDRYPNLRVVIRSGGGLMPLLLNRLNWPHKGATEVKRYHEIVREHFAADTRAPDARTLRFIYDSMGENSIVFGSDYAGGTGPLRAALDTINEQPDAERIKRATERNAIRMLRL